MAKYLIINADDYGMCGSANAAVEELFSLGRLKSATLMLPCPTAGKAVQFAIRHPEYAIGLHLTLTSEWKEYRWKPLSEGRSLVDGTGYMWHESREVEKNASYRDIERELRAQIEKALAMGMKPSHLDNHMGSLYGHYTGRFGLAKRTLKLCGEYGYSYRLFTSVSRATCPEGLPYPLCWGLARLVRRWSKEFHVLLPDYLLMPHWTEAMRADYETYRAERLKSWIGISEGVTETYLHPSLDTGEIRGISGRWQDRVWEYQLMKDPATFAYLEQNGVIPISHRELKSIKKEPR